MVRAASRSRSQTTARAAVKSGVVAFRTAPNPTGSVSAENAMSVKGTAENAAPATMKPSGFARTSGHVRRPKSTSRIAAPIAMRISAAQTAPTSGAAMRSERNAAPQTAPRKRIWARCAVVTGREGARGACMRRDSGG